MLSFFRTSASELGVSVGSHMLYSDDADQENIAVKTVILHEDYDSWTITNDICLLELASEATFGAHVGAIALPAAGAEYDSGTMCTVTGWGATSEGGDLADVLQKVSDRGWGRGGGEMGGGRGGIIASFLKEILTRGVQEKFVNDIVAAYLTTVS
jgi:hypothetical protein